MSLFENEFSPFKDAPKSFMSVVNDNINSEDEIKEKKLLPKENFNLCEICQENR